MKKEYISPQLIFVYLSEENIVTASIDGANARMFPMGRSIESYDYEDSRKAPERTIWDE